MLICMFDLYTNFSMVPNSHHAHPNTELPPNAPCAGVCNCTFLNSHIIDSLRTAIRYIVHTNYQNRLPTLPGAVLQNSPTRLPLDVNRPTDIVTKEAFLCNLWKVTNNGGFVGLFQTYHVIGPTQLEALTGLQKGQTLRSTGLCPDLQGFSSKPPNKGM